MWRMFVRELSDRVYKTAVNQETGEWRSCVQHKDGYIYSVEQKNVRDMGWKSVREFLQKKISVRPICGPPTRHGSFRLCGSGL